MEDAAEPKDIADDGVFFIIVDKMINIFTEYGYMLVFALFVVCAIVQSSTLKTKSFQKMFIILFLAGYCFIYAWRDISVGFDYGEYLRVYQGAFSSSLQNFITNFGYMETGYLALNWVLAFVHAAIPMFQLCIIVPTLYILYNNLIKKSNNCLFTLAALYGLGIFFNYMNQVRSSVAATICLLALKEAQEKKWKTAILVNLIACTIHTNAIVGFGLIVILFLKIKLSKRNLIVAFLGITVSWLLFDRVMLAVLKILPRYQGYFMEDKIETFIKRGSVNYLIVFSAIFVVAFYCRRYIVCVNQPRYDMLLWGNIMGIAFSAFCMKVSMMQRFMTLPLILCAELLSDAVQSIPHKKLRFLMYCLSGMALMGYCYIYLYVAEAHLGRDGIVPYAFME